MPPITFWEKPGCQTNAQQRRLLAEAGHVVIVRNLLTEAWTELRLLDFLMDLPVRDWFNPNSPRVKSGEIEPGLYDTTTALRAMLADPLLIRRPLIEVGNVCLAGFDLNRLRQVLSLPENTAVGVACASKAPPCAAP